MRSWAWRLIGWIGAVWIPVALLALGATLALCWFARPQFDDFAVAHEVTQRGLLGAQLDWYRQWTGKYTAMLAMSAVAAAVDIVHGYGRAPLLMLLATGAALWALSAQLRLRRAPGTSLGAAGLLLVVLVGEIPAPQESVYWLTGTYAYLLALTLVLLLLALLVRRCRTRLGRVIQAIAAASVAFAAVGCTETLMLPMVLLAGAWTLAALRGRVRWTTRGVAVTLAIAAGAAVMVLAPGNAVRSALFAERHDLLGAMNRALGRGVTHALRALASPTLLGAALLIAPALAVAARRLSPRRLGLPVKGLAAALLVLAVMPVAFFPAAWSTGHLAPPRAVASAWGALAIASLAVWAPLLRRVPAGRGAALGKALLVVGLLAQGNVPRAVRDLANGDAAAFARAHDQRAQRLRAATADEEVVLPALPCRPGSLFVDDITKNPADGPNQAVARFFGVKSVRTE